MNDLASFLLEHGQDMNNITRPVELEAVPALTAQSTKPRPPRLPPPWQAC